MIMPDIHRFHTNCSTLNNLRSGGEEVGEKRCNYVKNKLARIYQTWKVGEIGKMVVQLKIHHILLFAGVICGWALYSSQFSRMKLRVIFFTYREISNQNSSARKPWSLVHRGGVDDVETWCDTKCDVIIYVAHSLNMYLKSLFLVFISCLSIPN